MPITIATKSPSPNVHTTYITYGAQYSRIKYTPPHFNQIQKTNARSALRLTGTHYSCIIRVGAGTSKVGGRTAAPVQSQLCPWTIHIAIPGWTTSSSKVSRPGSFNCYRISQLMAHNCSISKVPVVITHSAPLAKEKDLNTTFQQSIPSHQSYRAFWSCIIRCYIYRSNALFALISEHDQKCPLFT